MDEIKYHISLFPPRLQNVLRQFDRWDDISEIRLRRDAPLSLTDQKGNVTLNERGLACAVSEGICCHSDDLSYLLGAFCEGSVYRYFERLQNGYVVNDYGWRMGISTPKEKSSIFLPQEILGINLRIPRPLPFVAEPIVKRICEEGLFSLLIFSPPGEGKTTILRSLAAMLSLGSSKLPAFRVSVIDENGELFPPQMKMKTGLLDLIPSCPKGEGIAQATKLFSPQIILCDEICSLQDSAAVLNAGSGGCHIMATAHARTPEEAKRFPHLAQLMDSGRFRYAVFLRKVTEPICRIHVHWENLP